MDLVFKVKKPERDQFVVVEDFSRHTYTVPSGFVFDGASVPWILRSFIGGRGRPRTLEPACLHDYLWENGGVSRKVADQVLRNDLKSAGVRGSWFYWVAVRLFARWKYGDWS